MRRLAPLFFAFVLAGCGARGALHAAPPLAADAGSRQVQSSNVDRYGATLWYGDGQALHATPVKANGLIDEIDPSYGDLQDPVDTAITVAPDDTVYDLITIDAHGTPRWKLQIYAPFAYGSAVPEEIITGSGQPRQVVLVGDGIDVLANGPSGSTIATFAYGAGSNPNPVRTLSFGYQAADFASDGSDELYVAHAGCECISVYAATARGAARPIRRIATNGKVPDAVAVAADGTVYAEIVGVAVRKTTIDAYALGNDGPVPSRKIGPYFTQAADAPAGRIALGAATGGITVDAAGNVYAGFTGPNGRAGVAVFLPTANGPSGPARTIAMRTQGSSLTSIAIGRGSVALGPRPNRTLYVLESGAFDEYTANGGRIDPAAARYDGILTGVQNPRNSIAVQQSGSIYVNAQGGSAFAQYAEGPNGTATKTAYFEIPPVFDPLAIAAGPGDAVYVGGDSRPNSIQPPVGGVEAYTPHSVALRPVASLSTPMIVTAIAAAANGWVAVQECSTDTCTSASSRVVAYDLSRFPGTVGGPVVVEDPAPADIVSLAMTPTGDVYVAARNGSVSYYPRTSGSYALRASYANATDSPIGIALDADGIVYVLSNGEGGSKNVKTYGPGLTNPYFAPMSALPAPATAAAIAVR